MIRFLFNASRIFFIGFGILYIVFLITLYRHAPDVPVASSGAVIPFTPPGKHTVTPAVHYITSAENTENNVLRGILIISFGALLLSRRAVKGRQ